LGNCFLEHCDCQSRNPPINVVEESFLHLTVGIQVGATRFCERDWPKSAVTYWNSLWATDVPCVCVPLCYSFTFPFAYHLASSAYHSVTIWKHSPYRLEAFAYHSQALADHLEAFAYHSEAFAYHSGSICIPFGSICIPFGSMCLSFASTTNRIP